MKRLSLLPLATLCSILPALSQTNSDPWPQHAGNAQHTAAAPAPLQPTKRILWTAPVDTAPQYNGSALFIHYTSPMITRGGTVVFPVKTAATGGFMLDGRRASDGVRRWSVSSDYILPDGGGWTPMCGAAIVTNPSNRAKASAVIVGAGGKIFVRDFADDAVSRVRTLFFYDQSAYKANPSAFDSSVFINTPLTVDGAGNIYFGYMVTAENPLKLRSGFVKINLAGVVTTTTILNATGGKVSGKVATNCAPAISNDGQTVYFAVNGSTPYLVGLKTANLAPKALAPLTDPYTNTLANVTDLSTSSPMVAPDGSVYYGIIENPWGSNRLRGWMLRFNASLVQQGAPGAFGWDNTPSLVPKAAVPSYKGSSPYLLLTKYNDYAQTGGSGKNKVAILDPFDTQVDPTTNHNTMKEVITIVGPTADNASGGVREWCVNTAAVDVAGKCAMINSEDGISYRWDFKTNALTEAIRLTSGLGEAYTPTIIGPDGRGYAINNATLFVLGSR